ncbi:hypothetical protein Ahu01nite_043590 [Winogradskya humida]|uniref:Uncharacterized protein n=1 Tax=Winogradskya humida TaxID=113566 RepID=A0ABQ3ZRP3_9ACTN|nr:hypothetical protein Ahu01nite_043590 [Actinoplanes humidus]
MLFAHLSLSGLLGPSSLLGGILGPSGLSRELLSSYGLPLSSRGLPLGPRSLSFGPSGLSLGSSGLSFDPSGLLREYSGGGDRSGACGRRGLACWHGLGCCSGCLLRQRAGGSSGRFLRGALSRGLLGRVGAGQHDDSAGCARQQRDDGEGRRGHPDPERQPSPERLLRH